MSYLEELLPEFRKGAKIRRKCWAKEDYYIKLSGLYARDKNNDVYFIDPNELMAKDWEFYKEPEPDWDYIIKNKCLCWFWDEKFNCAMSGTLGKIEKSGKYRFIMFDDVGNRSLYKHCRPVCKDEVTFYEDRKDD